MISLSFKSRSLSQSRYLYVSLFLNLALALSLSQSLSQSRSQGMGTCGEQFSRRGWGWGKFPHWGNPIRLTPPPLPTLVVTTQNINVVCDFNMCFTFTWASWEGTAHDLRICIEAL